MHQHTYCVHHDACISSNVLSDVSGIPSNTAPVSMFAVCHESIR